MRAALFYGPPGLNNFNFGAITAKTAFIQNDIAGNYSQWVGGSSDSGIGMGSMPSLVATINGYNKAFTVARDIALQINGGNVGIGIAPSVWTGYGVPVLEMTQGGTIVSQGTALTLGSGWYYNNPNFLYKNAQAAAYFQVNFGQFKWYSAPAGAVDAPITFGRPMTLDLNGNLLVGLTSGTVHNIAKNVTEGNDILYVVGNPGVTFAVQYGTGQGWSTAKSVVFAGQNSTTLRSANFAGTVNANGTDYAEYMFKADDCSILAKGQIVGVDVHGKLTDKFDDAVSFLIKSTDPSYVGGDTWGTEESLGIKRPIEPAFDLPEQNIGESESDYKKRIAVAENQHAELLGKYRAELKLFEAAHEIARQKVDRIAYCGQVPVNVHNAKVGQYIVPDRGPRGEINGLAILRRNMTLEYYMAAVGVVQNILPDGRANVRVKVV